MHRPVVNKRDFVHRYKDGEFGNAAPTWNTVQEFLEYYSMEFPPDNELFHLRSKVKGGKTHYNLTYLEIIHTTLKEDYYVSAMAPTEKTLIQGELQRTIQGLYLHYTMLKLPMRDALSTRSSSITGLGAKLLLSRYLNYKSQEWMTYLLDSYEDHVVEFSAYSNCWGTLTGYNTVFWEVRLY